MEEKGWNWPHASPPRLHRPKSHTKTHPSHSSSSLERPTPPCTSSSTYTPAPLRCATLAHAPAGRCRTPLPTLRFARSDGHPHPHACSDETLSFSREGGRTRNGLFPTSTEGVGEGGSRNVEDPRILNRKLPLPKRTPRPGLLRSKGPTRHRVEAFPKKKEENEDQHRARMPRRPREDDPRATRRRFTRLRDCWTRWFHASGMKNGSTRP
eukprot:scaffold47_cov334-Pavlova_lutheri.AAC.5